MPRSLLVLALVSISVLALPSEARAQANLPQIMVVAVAHLEAKDDVYNSTWGSSVFAPAMQAQIAQVTKALAKFRPNKVMIEARADNPKFVQRYEAYLRGAYRLGPNEDDQFGYRLARMLGLTTIYPIDSTGDFPFDYDAARAAAAKSGQTFLVTQANAEIAPLVARSGQLERASDLVGVLRYFNSADALRLNAGWYMYLDLIGSSSDHYLGQVLTSTWYARNLQIFANIARNLKPGERALVFIGQGHAAMLRPMIDRSPFLKDVDPEKYLPMR